MHYDLTKQFFANRMITVWISLPQDIDSAYSVNNFKNKLDKCWMYNACKFDSEADKLETGNQN